MKKLLLTGLTGLLTIGTATITISQKVNALTSHFNTHTVLSNSSISPDNTSASSQIDRPSSIEVAADVAWECRTYPNGSYACCAVDSYGNWYCESGQ